MELVEIWLFGALLEIIGDDNYLVNELKKLNVDGYKIEILDKAKNGITGNNGEEYIYPEYESLKEIAEKNNIPIKELYKL